MGRLVNIELPFNALSEKGLPMPLELLAIEGVNPRIKACNLLFSKMLKESVEVRVGLAPVAIVLVPPAKKVVKATSKGLALLGSLRSFKQALLTKREKGRIAKMRMLVGIRNVTSNASRRIRKAIGLAEKGSTKCNPFPNLSSNLIRGHVPRLRGNPSRVKRLVNEGTNAIILSRRGSMRNCKVRFNLMSTTTNELSS